MRRKKNFDCVEMKRRIQEDLLREEEESGPEEARRRQMRRVLDEPILGPFLARVTRRSRSGGGVAE